MKCKQAQSLLAGFMDKKLNEQEDSAIQIHLRECSDCSKLLAQFEQYRIIMNGMAINELPSEIVDHVRHAVAEVAEKQKHSPAPFWRMSFTRVFMPIAGFALLGIIVFSIIDRNKPITNTVPVSQQTMPIQKTLGQPTNIQLSKSTHAELPAEADISLALRDDIKVIEQGIAASVQVAKARENEDKAFLGVDSGMSMKQKEAMKNVLQTIELSQLKINQDIEKILMRRALRLEQLRTLKKLHMIGESLSGTVELIRKDTQITELDQNALRSENDDRAALVELYAQQIDQKKSGNLQVKNHIKELLTETYRISVHPYEYIRHSDGSWSPSKNQ